MVNTLQFNMSLPTPYVFMKRFLKAAQSDKKVSFSYHVVKFDQNGCSSKEKLRDELCFSAI